MEAMGEGKHGEFNLPGFRFHPTEEELVGFYLRRKAQGQRFSVDIIGTLDLYRFDPWQLPGQASTGEKEWFFFVPRNKRCPAPRRSRLTVSGYWKATGSDRPIRDQGLQCIGLKKILVFYKGKAPRGDRTDWIMNEYRLPDYWPTIQKDIVLCRIYRKPTSLKVLELRAKADNIGGGKEEEESFEASGEEKPPPMTTFNGFPSNSLKSMKETEESSLNCHHHYYNQLKSYESLVDDGSSSVNPSCSLDLMEMMEFKDNKFKPPELQVPKFSVENFLSQAIVSPWTENTWTPSLWISTPMDSFKHIGNL